MSALSIQPTYPIFTETDGQPLEDGYIWIGTANLDPQTNPISVYWDTALTISAPQPIRTLGGYPSRNGTPARLYVNSDYSIRVMNRNGSTVYSAPAATERYSEVVVSAIDAENVIYNPPFVGGVQTNAEEKFAETVSIADFGADPAASGSVNHAAILAAFAASKSVYVPPGIYTVTGDTITIPDNTEFFGAGKYATTINFTPDGDKDCFVIGWYTTLRDMKIVDQFGAPGTYGTLRMQSLTNPEIPTNVGGNNWRDPSVGGLSYKNTLRDLVLESGHNYNIYMVNVAYIDIQDVRAVLGRGGAGNVSIWGKGGVNMPESTTVFMSGSNEFTASLAGPGLTLHNVASSQFQFIAEGNYGRAMTATGDIPTCTWRNCYFESNHAQGAPVGDAEAGIAAITSNLVFEGCLFFQNNSNGSLIVAPGYASGQYNEIRSCVFAGANFKAPSVPDDGSWNIYLGQNNLSNQYDLLTNAPDDFNVSRLRSSTRLFPIQVFNTDPYSKTLNSLFKTWTLTYPDNWTKVGGTNDVVKNISYRYWKSPNSVQFAAYPCTLLQQNIQDEMDWNQKSYTAVIVGRNGMTITPSSPGYDGSNRTYVQITGGAPPANYFLEFPELVFGSEWTAYEIDLAALFGQTIFPAGAMVMDWLIVCAAGTVIGHAGIYASDSPNFIPE